MTGVTNVTHDVREKASELTQKAQEALEGSIANTVKDTPSVRERLLQPGEAQKRTALTVYDPKALWFASLGTGALGVYSALSLPTLVAGTLPMIAGVGTIGYAASAISLRNAHNLRQRQSAYDVGTLTSMAMAGYSAYRFRATPHVTATALGVIGAASLFTNGLKSYELRYGQVRK